MSDDASPENLRKFLESDDPAMRRMGLSMAKGGGVPEELYKNIFGLSLWDPEAENREAAENLVDEIGLENITEFPGWLEPFEEDDIDEDEYDVCSNAVDALGEIGGVPAPWRVHHFATGTEQQRLYAVELLIEALGDGSSSGSESAADVLGEIGGTDAVEPLIWVLYGGHSYGEVSGGVLVAAATALGDIGDGRAVEPLIVALGTSSFGTMKYDGTRLRRAAAMALGKIGETDRGQGGEEWGYAVEPLIKASGDEGEDEEVRDAAKEALRKLGHEVE